MGTDDAQAAAPTQKRSDTVRFAVAEWEREELGKRGAQRYREWLASTGIAKKLSLSLETYDGEVVVASQETRVSE